MTELQIIQSAKNQYRAMFKSMAASGAPWNIHKGSQGPVLLIAGAHMDVDLPIIVSNVHAMAEQTMVNALSSAIRRAQ